MRNTLLCMLALAAAVCAQRKPGSPLDHLPAHIQTLTYFGERADFSPDNKRVAFMAKSFGDAFVIDLETRVIRCLTCSVPGAAFLRVMHLADGGYLLIGPERFKELRASRREENELWYLDAAPGSKPVRFGQRMSEGAAVSKKNPRIAYSETRAQNPDLPPGHSRLWMADVDRSGGVPRLANKKMVWESKDSGCTIEAQDFFDNDTKMTFTCYQPKGLAAVMTIDLKTGEVKDQSQAPGWYNEVEGIFPDGKHTCVEADRQVGTLGGGRGMRQIDIWKLRLDGTGKSFERMTHFNDHEGWKASNPVISTDGRYMAFQVARAADEAGVGYGIMLYKLK